MKNNNGVFRPLLDNISNIEEISKFIIGNNKENYFDYTASGLAFEPIENRIREVLNTYANTHSEFSHDSKVTSFNYDIARENIKSHLKLDDNFVLLPCGSGATSAIKKFQELIGLYIPPQTKKKFNIDISNLEKPLVIVGPFEHHSNEISYREALCDIIRIPLDKTGNVDLEYLENVLQLNTNRQIIGSFSIASNVTGIMSPYEKISKLFRQYDAIIVFDAAASSPCVDIDCKLYDALFLSPHKLLGGPGSCGLLVIRSFLIDVNLPPTFAGGGTVAYVSRDKHNFNSDIEIREDAGTPAILQLIKASLVYQLREEIGFEKIKEKKIILLNLLKNELYKMGSNTIYGQNTIHDSIGIIALNFNDISPYELCEKLSQNYGIQTRAGCSCAGPYGHDLFGINSNDENKKPSWLRISIHYSHSIKSIHNLIFALKKSIEQLK